MHTYLSARLQGNMAAAHGWALETAQLWAAFLEAGGRRPADEQALHRLDARYFSCESHSSGCLSFVRIPVDISAAGGVGGCCTASTPATSSLCARCCCGRLSDNG